MNKKITSQDYELITIIGKNIQDIRINKNISIEELSKKTKIKENYLKRIEKGLAIRMTLGQLFEIAIALKVQPSELVKGV